MKTLRLVPDGFKCALGECPPGLFLCEDETMVGFKTDYDEYYLAIDGDAFWGGTSSKEERAKIIVQPLRYEWVEHDRP